MALVVTIVVLLILAGVSLNLILGNNGIIGKSNEAKEKYAAAQTNEQSDLDNTLEWINGLDPFSNVKIYAKRYSYDDGSGSLLELSSDSEHETTKEGVTFAQDYGNIGSKQYKNIIKEEYIKNADGTVTSVLTQEGSILPPWLELITYEEEYNITNIYVDSNNIIKVNIVDEIEPISTACWFWQLNNMEGIENIANIKTNNVIDMSWMFGYCSALTELDLSGFDTGNVTDMSYMFLSCENITELDVSGFNTENVTDMSCMFNSCENITELDVSRFNTENVTDMSYMFSYCENITELDVSRFDTGNVTSMIYMFADCRSLTKLDVSGFNTENVTSMTFMFANCSSLTKLDLSGFDTGNVTSMTFMFENCSSLTKLDLSGFDTGNVTDMSCMFFDCRGLTSIYVGENWVTSKADTTAMFTGCGTSEVTLKEV